MNVWLRNHRGCVYWAHIEKWLNKWSLHLGTECQDIWEGKRRNSITWGHKTRNCTFLLSRFLPVFPQRTRGVRSCWLVNWLTAFCLFLMMAYITSTLEGTQTSSTRVLACCSLVSVSRKWSSSALVEGLWTHVVEDGRAAPLNADGKLDQSLALQRNSTWTP